MVIRAPTMIGGVISMLTDTQNNHSKRAQSAGPAASTREKHNSHCVGGCTDGAEALKCVVPTITW